MFWFSLAALAILGVLARYGLVELLRLVSPDFPAGTWIANILGSFLIGVFYVSAEHWNLSSDFKKAIMIGLFGAFTTYSSYSLEVFQLFERSPLQGLVYGVAAPITCTLACASAIWLTR